MIVIDASVVAPALSDDAIDGERARARLHRERLLAPEILDLEVISVIRRALSIGAIDARRATFAIGDLFDLDLERVAHRLLLERIWELRSNVTPYDGAYIALAEALGARLVTADRRLARAPMVRCEIEYIGSADVNDEGGGQ